jgi:hypothetical protein
MGIGRWSGRGWASTPAKSTKCPWNSGLLVVPSVRLEVLVGHGAARREIGAERPELRVEVARADPEHDSTAR